jgi:hypothetical protein
VRLPKPLALNTASPFYDFRPRKQKQMPEYFKRSNRNLPMVLVKEESVPSVTWPTVQATQALN